MADFRERPQVGQCHGTRRAVIPEVLPRITSFSPTSGKVGTSVVISGGGLTKASQVMFGGVNATSFTVNSTSKVTATVPTGAMTGKIAITAPSGTATSSGSFTQGAALSGSGGQYEYSRAAHFTVRARHGFVCYLALLRRNLVKHGHLRTSADIWKGGHHIFGEDDSLIRFRSRRWKQPWLGGDYRLRIPVTAWYMPDGELIEGKGVKPDCEVRPSLENLRAGIDVQMEEAVRTALALK
jgi:hypothetical protein